MIKRSVLSAFVVCGVALYGEQVATEMTKKRQNLEFAAEKVYKDGDKTYAEGGVLVYSEDYVASGDRAVYDEAAGVVELFGSVSVMRGESEASHAQYAKIGLNDKSFEFESSFVIDKDKEIWMRGQSSCSKDDLYLAKGAVVSSCNVSDPDWHIEFSSGELNKTSKFLHLYNPVFYVGRVPVMWLPYFGFSTDKTRRTGLLTPEFAFGRDYGLYYMQPFYIAEFDSWDLELDPQVRTRRGVGSYGAFRFVDSAYSRGEIRFGGFKDSARYASRENLQNRHHYGYEVDYDSDMLARRLISGDFSEGLWLQYTQLNDVDYLNLKNKNSIDYDSLVQSRLNYFIASDNHYAGIYAKYYFDTAKIGSQFKNYDTMQELPTAHYHTFLQSLFDDHLTYSIDAKARNLTRKIGTTARQYELEIPVGLNFSLLDGWGNISFSENIYTTQVNYGDNYYYANGQFLQNKSDSYINQYHKISLNSELARGFESLFHTLSFELDYIKPGFHKGKLSKNILKYYMINPATYRVDDPRFFEDNFIAFQDGRYAYESASFGVSQFFYSGDGDKVLHHSFRQDFDIDESSARVLENRFDIYLGDFIFTNKIEFSNQLDRITKLQTAASYADSVVDGSIWHTYSAPASGELIFDKESYISASAGVKLPFNYRIFAQAQYDFQREYTKMWQAGINYRRKCWDYSLAYRKDIEPKNSSAGLESKRTQGVYLLFSFYPLGTLNYDFSVESDNSGDAD